MTFTYVKMRYFNNHKYMIGLMIFSMFLIFSHDPRLINRGIIGFFFSLFSFSSMYAIFLYHKKYSLITDDKGFQVNYFNKQRKFAWSDVVAIKNGLFGYKIETKQGSIRFNPKGLLPVELCSGQKEEDTRHLEGVLIGEIVRKAPAVRLVRISKELFDEVRH
ncbi:MAG: hypothetical protein EPN25_02540 [Nitrospirae bacterium]|nr:MAG: hypothetical protein EPN25_02540 [Nitrospirota bacterium]